MLKMMNGVRVMLDNAYAGEFANCISEIPMRFEREGVMLYDKRNVIKSFCLKADENRTMEVVVKRYKRLFLFQRLIYTFFRKSKAQRAFVNAGELRRRGFDTPREVACLEEFRGGLLQFGYYVTCRTSDSAIRECLVDRPEFDRGIAEAFAAFVAQLHEHGILHHDLNPTNVLYRHNADGTVHFSLIDINRMTFYPDGKSIDVHTCFDNLTRFTGRMDLYEYVLRSYIDYRGWNKNLLEQAINIKQHHDRAWRRRKDLLGILKRL